MTERPLARHALVLALVLALVSGAAVAIGTVPAAPTSSLGGVRAIATTPTGKGYWLVDGRGVVVPVGDARSYGSTETLSLNRPIAGIDATPTGRGYWLVAEDGGVFAFGDARFHGSTGALSLNRPIVGIAGTPSGAGYWLVASDGGVFTFGDARFFGSTGALSLNRPIVGIAGTPSGAGYWLVASDGGVFTFGDARFYGSTGGMALQQPVVGIAPTDAGAGYWLIASDGGVFTFGGARFLGSLASGERAWPVTAVASGRGGYVLADLGGGVTGFGVRGLPRRPSAGTGDGGTIPVEPPPPPAPPAGATVRSTLGAFAPTPRQLVSYSDWVGHQVRSGLAYASWRYDWAAWRRSISAIVNNYTDPQYTFSPRVVLSVPMIVRGDGGTLRDGANGRYDEQWRWLAHLLVDEYGSSLARRFVLRLGHESNIKYYQWSARPDSHNGVSAPEDFAAYWRRIHGIMTPIVRAAGSDITWNWNVASSGSRDTAERSYPGDPYVDVVTVDFYDHSGDPDDVLWRRPCSLNGWLVPFADAHRKPIGIDEWSVYWNGDTHTGGGDNPAFVTAVYEWLDTQVRAGRLLWHHQFDIDTDDDTFHRMRPDGRFPFTNSRARFLQLFGT
jgi:hypothetical protein